MSILPPLFMTIMSATFGFLSNSWMMTWIFLEINTFSFIILTKTFKNPPSKSMNYLIVQTISSILLLTTILLMKSLNPNFYKPQMIPLMSIIIFMKMGMFPLHNWMIQFIKNLNFKLIITTLTIQKIIPIKIMKYSPLNNFMLILILTNIIFSIILFSNSKNIQMMMNASSIYNMAWISTTIFFFPKTSIIYFLIYSMIFSNLMMIMSSMNMYNLNQKIKKININLLILTLSMASLPPFLGFLNKIILITSFFLIKISNLLILILIQSSFFMTFFYLRLLYSTFLLNLKSKTLFQLNNPIHTLTQIIIPTQILLL